ncbi:unnamed protein product [Caenorhabditis nigoni]
MGTREDLRDFEMRSKLPMMTSRKMDCSESESSRPNTDKSKNETGKMHNEPESRRRENSESGNKEMLRRLFNDDFLDETFLF